MSQTIMDSMMRMIKGYGTFCLLDQADLSISVYLMTSESDYSHHQQPHFRCCSLYSLCPYVADFFCIVIPVLSAEFDSIGQVFLSRSFTTASVTQLKTCVLNTGLIRVSGVSFSPNALRYPQSQ